MTQTKNLIANKKAIFKKYLPWRVKLVFLITDDYIGRCPVRTTQISSPPSPGNPPSWRRSTSLLPWRAWRHTLRVPDTLINREQGISAHFSNHFNYNYHSVATFLLVLPKCVVFPSLRI